ncbi:Retrovirus-related Pol polyprotein from transposon 17.6 [Gossypium australe]|uniref:Retrovirus-related Pol polyprotein from transposon 17.6 n=1 Tax=Gossypium australe TaxID=47621 RepID=A0A5B6VCE8_9ROSI|nr:Retrovirus-related Pol polyprotein from transposon 17.6 [Gossypium australe]
MANNLVHSKSTHLDYARINCQRNAIPKAHHHHLYCQRKMIVGIHSLNLGYGNGPVNVLVLGYLSNSMNISYLPLITAIDENVISELLQVSKSETEHDNHLRNLLQVLHKKQLYGKLRKCEFWLPEVVFQGQVISNEGICVDPKKIEAILQ